MRRRAPQLAARRGIVTRDETAFLLEALAAVDAADDDAIGDHRAGRVRVALREIGLGRAPDLAAGARVDAQRSPRHTWRG